MLNQAILAGMVILNAAVTVYASDEEFVTKAAKDGIAAVELGRLASDKGSSEVVRQFGERMVDDHNRTNGEVQALAQRKNVIVSPALDRDEQDLRDRLMKLTGRAFDQAYIMAMVSDHVKDVREFRIESAAGSDPEVKAWAARTVPMLEGHLRMAQAIEATFETSGKRSSRHD